LSIIYELQADISALDALRVDHTAPGSKQVFYADVG
jgi:hypothetical protein